MEPEINVHFTAPEAAGEPMRRPALLPPDVPLFTGRTEELIRLDTLLDARNPEAGSAGRLATSVLITAIAGAGGMGKTALAVHWAHRVREQFPGGQLYVNLRGYDPSPPLTPAQALDAFLRTMGFPGSMIPQDLDAMSGLYRSLMADQQVLIVLDNAATAEQIRPLLPNTPTCLVLVTSRSRLPGLIARDGAHRITLGQLSSGEALNLLREIIGSARVDAELEATRELARRCAGLPLALRIAAERIADRPHHSIADLAAALTNQRRLDLLTVDDDEATAVRVVFAWSYRDLQPGAALLFRLLGLHPGPTISAAAAAALAGTRLAKLRPLLNTLTNGHLLTEIDRDRYQFHDLLRDYAAEQTRGTDSERIRATAVRRLLTWYLHTAHNGARLLNPFTYNQSIGPDDHNTQPLEFTTREQALHWYDTEHPNLLAAVQQAAECGHHDIAAHFARAVRSHLTLRARWADDLAISTIAHASACHTHDRSLELATLSCVGEAHFNMAQYDDCADCYQQIIPKAHHLGERRWEAGGHHMIGMVLNAKGKLEAATDRLQIALRLYREINDQRGEALMLCQLGDICRRQRRFREALDLTCQSLTILRSTGNRWNEAVCVRQLARVCVDQNQLSDAISQFQHATAIYREVDDRYEIARTLHMLGDTLQTNSQPANAHQVWREALAIYEELHVPQASELRTHLTTAEVPNRNEWRTS